MPDIAPGRSEEGDFFGFSLAAGELDSDGMDDLVIGVPGEDCSGGNDWSLSIFRLPLIVQASMD